MQKKLYIRVRDLFVSPDREWMTIFNDNMSVREVFLTYNMPLIVLSTVAVFVGSLINHHAPGVEVAFMHAMYTFVAFFTSLYAAYFLMLKVLTAIDINHEKDVVFKLIALPSLLLYFTHLIITLFPELFFLRLVNFYAIFIIYKGYNNLFAKNDHKKVLLSMITSVIVLLLPLVIFHILYKLSGL